MLLIRREWLSFSDPVHTYKLKEAWSLQVCLALNVKFILCTLFIIYKTGQVSPVHHEVIHFPEWSVSTHRFFLFKYPQLVKVVLYWMGRLQFVGSTLWSWSRKQLCIHLRIESKQAWLVVSKLSLLCVRGNVQLNLEPLSDFWILNCGGRCQDVL